jgi:hypothetical protein
VTTKALYNNPFFVRARTFDDDEDGDGNGSRSAPHVSSRQPNHLLLLLSFTCSARARFHSRASATCVYIHICVCTFATHATAPTSSNFEANDFAYAYQRDLAYVRTFVRSSSFLLFTRPRFLLYWLFTQFYKSVPTALFTFEYSSAGAYKAPFISTRLHLSPSVFT